MFAHESAKPVGLRSTREIRAALAHLSSEGLLVPKPGVEDMWLAAEGHRTTYLSSLETHQVADHTSQVGQETAQPTAQVGSETAQPTSQVGPETAQLTTEAMAKLFHGAVSRQRVLEELNSPRTISQLMAATGLRHRVSFRRVHIQPLLEAGLIQPEHPEPNHPRQRYLLTDAGWRVLAALKQGQAT